MNVEIPYKNKKEIRHKMSDLGLGVRELARIIGANEREIRAVLSPISETKIKRIQLLAINFVLIALDDEK